MRERRLSTAHVSTCAEHSYAVGEHNLQRPTFAPHDEKPMLKMWYTGVAAAGCDLMMRMASLRRRFDVLSAVALLQKL